MVRKNMFTNKIIYLHCYRNIYKCEQMLNLEKSLYIFIIIRYINFCSIFAVYKSLQDQANNVKNKE